MFPGRTIPQGYFQYGKDYTATGPDNSNVYIYSLVLSTPPQTLGLMRVKITEIGLQDATKWTYYSGPAANPDGMTDANWSLSASSFTPLITSNAGNGYGAQYLPYYQQYILIGSQDTDTQTHRVWRPKIAPHPWGPWTDIPNSTFVSDPAGQYSSNVVSKSVAADGGRTFTTVSAGNWNDENVQNGVYTLWLIPATLN
jgi:hypothetical protein